MTFLSRKQFRHVAAGDLLRQAFDDRGFADAGFAEQHRIILRPAAEHLDDALDFVVAADHRIELALLRQFREVTAKGAQGRRLHVFLAGRLAAPAAFAAPIPAA